MATIEVSPESFSMVNFDAEVIRGIGERLSDEVGLGADELVRIEIDEASSLGRARLESDADPILLSIEGGSFEDTRRPRQLSEKRTADVVGRLLLRVIDRRSEEFGSVPADDDLSFAHSIAWDVYAVGRLVRLGYPGQRRRRLYQFRNRHGFTDVADAAFERLWQSENLCWTDIAAISDDAAAAASGEIVG